MRNDFYAQVAIWLLSFSIVGLNITNCVASMEIKELKDQVREIKAAQVNK